MSTYQLTAEERKALRWFENALLCFCQDIENGVETAAPKIEAMRQRLKRYQNGVKTRVGANPWDEASFTEDSITIEKRKAWKKKGPSLRASVATR